MCCFFSELCAWLSWVCRCVVLWWFICIICDCTAGTFSRSGSEVQTVPVLHAPQGVQRCHDNCKWQSECSEVLHMLCTVQIDEGYRFVIWPAHKKSCAEYRLEGTSITMLPTPIASEQFFTQRALCSATSYTIHLQLLSCMYITYVCHFRSYKKGLVVPMKIDFNNLKVGTKWVAESCFNIVCWYCTKAQVLPLEVGTG